MTDDAKQNRRIYAKGYYDGLRFAGINIIEGENYMTAKARKPEPRQTAVNTLTSIKEDDLKAQLNVMTSLPRLVYDCVPIASPWTSVEITNEVVRKGENQSLSVIERCIAALINTGVVKELTKGKYIRTKVIHKKPDTDSNVISMTAKTEPQSSLDILVELSGKAFRLAQEVKSLAESIETAALNIAEQTQSSEAQAEKLRQLQKLLKSLGE